MRRFLAVVFLLASFHAVADTYHVSPSGDDDQDGTQEFPWRTIQHAADSVAPGDTVVILDGEYPEQVVISTSGQPGLPITFTAENPTLPHRDFAGECPHDRPRITGPPGDSCSDNGLIHIDKQDHLAFIGLEISRHACYDGDNYAYDIRVIASSHLQFQYLDLHHPGGLAHHIEIYGASEDIRILDCTAHHGRSASAIDVAQDLRKPDNGRPDDVTIAGNWIYDINPDFQDGIGAGIATERMDHAHVYDNEVHFSRMGLDIGCGVENRVHHNRLIDVETGIGISGNQHSVIHDNFVKVADGADEGMLSYDHEDDHDIGERHVGNKWYRNFVINAWRPFREYNKKPADWPDAESLDQVVFNNVFVNSRSYVELTNSQDFLFFNNTVYGGGLTTDATGRIENNIVLGGSIDSTATQGHNLTDPADAALENPGGTDPLDYRLTAGSAAVGQAQNLSGLEIDGSHLPAGCNVYDEMARDFEGKLRGPAWDIGAFELEEDTTEDPPPAPPTDLTAQ